MAVLIWYVILAIIFFSIAELFGRSKHIGRWWAFLLLFNFIIPGIVAIIFSPSAKKQPTKGTKIHVIIGLVVILVGIGMIPKMISGNSMASGIFVAHISIGVYLIQLGRGKIRNNKPKYYFSKIYETIANSHLGDNLFNTKRSATPIQSMKYNQHIYFIVQNKKQSEPLTYNQLKEIKINETTYVWRKGLQDWVKAGELNELGNIILFTPPPFKPKTDEQELPPPFKK